VRLRQELGLRCKQKRKFKATTNSRHTFPVAENMLNQTFAPTRPNEARVTDITYVMTDEDWLLLETDVPTIDSIPQINAQSLCGRCRPNKAEITPRNNSSGPVLDSCTISLRLAVSAERSASKVHTNASPGLRHRLSASHRRANFPPQQPSIPPNWLPAIGRNAAVCRCQNVLKNVHYSFATNKTRRLPRAARPGEQ